MMAGGEKVMPLDEAVRRYVRPGCHLHLGYGDARPNAAVMEILRQFHGTAPAFTLSSAGITGLQHTMIAERLVAHLITSFVGESYPAPSPSRIFREALHRGELTVENWSLWTYVARLAAGALGLPFFPVNSLRGSGMEDEHAGREFDVVQARFGDCVASAGVVSALRPDVAVLHGAAADEQGNVILAAPYGEAHWGALAARDGVIATVEKVVPAEVIRAHSTLPRVPGHVVRAVVETPLGSHPYSLFRPGLDGVAGYTQDAGFIARLQSALKDPAHCSAWLDEWVYKVCSHQGYLHRIGPDTIARLRGAALADAWTFEPLTDDVPVAGPGHQLVAAAARLAEQHVRDQGLQAILAGIGLANLAAWMAHGRLLADGLPVELMAEIGMYGYQPRPGDPFVFANRNLHASTELTDIARVLGLYVGGPATRCLGLIGAAQVDRRGNVNSTRAADGGYLLGSGGANDIASAAQDVIVIARHAPDRLVEQVPFVTSPGDRVSAIVTTEGVLTRRAGEFVLTSYFARSGTTERDRVAAIRAATGWDLRIAQELTAEPEPSPSDLRTLSRYDPHGAFLEGGRR